jgi:SAM-dependent methyltransferase
MIDEKRLSEIIPEGVGLRYIEPHIYSIYPPGENTNPYDGIFGAVYDFVAGNRLYNRLMWGYSISEYRSFCLEALESSNDGWVLDAGCGTLAFTAKTYSNYSGRPVVLLDQSVRSLMKAKARLMKICGKVPGNLVFLHGDALNLPFKPKSFGTVISLNLLHVLEDLKRALVELKRVSMDGGSMYFTTLIENNRFGDGYLRRLGKSGFLFPRDAKGLISAFDSLGMTVGCDIKGNLAFVRGR